MQTNDEKTKTLSERLERFINNKWIELAIAVLIVASVILVLIETSLQARSHLVENANDALTFVFIIELSIRYYVADKKSRFFRSYWIDILAVIPVTRPLRILRVLRLFRLFRVGVILGRHFRVFRVVKMEYAFLGGVVLVTILIGSAGLRFAEGPGSDFASIENSLWFSTLSLVAGEPIGTAPQTQVGRLILLSLMLGGLTVFAVFTGTVSAFMTDSIQKFRIKHMELEDLTGHTIICGWNRSTSYVIEEILSHENRDIVVIAERPNLLEKDVFSKFEEHLFLLVGDYTRLSILNQAGIADASVAILLADASKEERSSQDRDARSVLAAMLIEKVNTDIFTSVQLHNRDNEASLRSIGVEEIIVTDDYVGGIMASVVRSHGIVSVLDELMTQSRGHNFYKCKCPSYMASKTVGEGINLLKAKEDSILLALEINGEIVVNPPVDLIINKEDYLFAAGKSPDA